MASGSILRWSYTQYLDRPGVMKRVGAYKASILARTGGLGRTIMRRQIRPRLMNKKARTVFIPETIQTVGGIVIPIVTKCYVDPEGLVYDLKTGKLVSTDTALKARAQAARNLRGQGEGKPPRQGRTNLLRKGMEFRLDPKTESVVIGVVPFANQPPLTGAVTVPQLLNYGGGEIIGGVLARYGARPYVEPTLPPTFKKMQQLILRRPIR